MTTYSEWRKPFGYSNPPTFKDYLDFCDRARCSPDSPTIVGWSPAELADRFNRESVRGGCTATIAAMFLAVEWPSRGKGTPLKFSR